MIISYLRVSTTDQTLHQQKAEIEKYAKAHNLKIDEFISDEGISAYNKSFEARNGLLRVLELVNEGNVSDLIVFETSRISRRYGEGVSLFETFTMKGVRVHSVVDNTIVNQNDIDQLMLAFRSWSNQQSSKLTSQRIKAKLSHMKEQGLYTGGTVPWGFTVVDNRVHPADELKETVIQFFNDYITFGTSYCLEKYNINNRMTLNKRIKNEMYSQIIGSELFSQANKVRESRSCRKDYTRTNRSKKLFEGLLIHSCRKKLYLSKQNDGTYYRCYNCKSTDRKMFKYKQLEDAIESEIISVFDNLSHEELKERYLLKIEKLKLIYDVEIKAIETEIESVEKAIANGKKKLQHFICEENSDVIIRQISELIEQKKEELGGLNFQLTKIKSKQNDVSNKIDIQLKQIENLLDAKEIYNNATLEQKKAILQLIVKRIEVKDYDNVDIFLNL